MCLTFHRSSTLIVLAVQVTGDGSHLAVMIRQRKDEELLDLQAKDRSLVVGRGRLSERDVAAMLESIRCSRILYTHVKPIKFLTLSNESLCSLDKILVSITR